MKAILSDARLDRPELGLARLQLQFRREDRKMLGYACSFSPGDSVADVVKSLREAADGIEKTFKAFQQ